MTCLLVSIITLIIPQLNKLSQSIRQHDMDHIITSLPPLFTNCVCFIKLFNLHINKLKFIRIFELIKEEWRTTELEDELHILREFADNGCKFGRLYRTYIFGVLAIFLCMPLAPTFLDTVLPQNESRQRNALYEIDYMIDNDKYFFYIYIHAAWSSICSILILVTVDTMYMLITYHACGLFALCGHRIKNLAQGINQDGFTDREDHEVYFKLRQCVVSHKKAIEFADFMEGCNTISYLLQIGINMISISITGVQTVIKLRQIEEATRFGVFTVAQNIHLFFNSLPGQKLVDSSLELSTVIYNSEWYKVPIRMQRMLLIMQIRCRKACKLTAGKLYDMNVENFGAIVKTSMSYFTMFLSLRD